MAKNKLDNCFIDELENYNYEIKTANDEYLASAKSLSLLDTSVIQKQSFSIVRDENGSILLDAKGRPAYDINVNMWEIYTIKQALTKWRWDREITVETIALLPADVRNNIFREIRRHEGFFEVNREAIEKN